MDSDPGATPAGLGVAGKALGCRASDQWARSPGAYPLIVFCPGLSIPQQQAADKSLGLLAVVF